MRLARLFTSTLLSFVALVAGGAFGALAAEIKPEWMRSRGGVFEKQAPSRMLQDETFRGLSKELSPWAAVTGDLLEAGEARELHRSAERMYDDYERNRAQSLNRNRVDQGFQSSSDSMINSTRGRMEKYVGEQRLTRDLKRVENRNEALQKGRPAAVVIGVAAVVATGREVRVPLPVPADIRSRLNLRDRTARLQVGHGIVGTGSVDLAQDVSERELDPSKSGDRYRFSFNRSLPVLGLSGQMSYGTSTSVFQTSLLKQLTPEISAEVAKTRATDGEQAARGGEESLRLNYTLSF